MHTEFSLSGTVSVQAANIRCAQDVSSPSDRGESPSDLAEQMFLMEQALYERSIFCGSIVHHGVPSKLGRLGSSRDYEASCPMQQQQPQATYTCRSAVGLRLQDAEEMLEQLGDTGMKRGHHSPHLHRTSTVLIRGERRGLPGLPESTSRRQAKFRHRSAKRQHSQGTWRGD